MICFAGMVLQRMVSPDDGGVLCVLSLKEQVLAQRTTPRSTFRSPSTETDFDEDDGDSMNAGASTSRAIDSADAVAHVAVDVMQHQPNSRVVVMDTYVISSQKRLARLELPEVNPALLADFKVSICTIFFVLTDIFLISSSLSLYCLKINCT